MPNSEIDKVIFFSTVMLITITAIFDILSPQEILTTNFNHQRLEKKYSPKIIDHKILTVIIVIVIIVFLIVIGIFYLYFFSSLSLSCSKTYHKIISYLKSLSAKKQNQHDNHSSFINNQRRKIDKKKLNFQATFKENMIVFVLEPEFYGSKKLFKELYHRDLQQIDNTSKTYQIKGTIKGKIQDSKIIEALEKIFLKKYNLLQEIQIIFFQDFDSNIQKIEENNQNNDEIKKYCHFSLLKKINRALQQDTTDLIKFDYYARDENNNQYQFVKNIENNNDQRKKALLKELSQMNYYKNVACQKRILDFFFFRFYPKYKKEANEHQLLSFSDINGFCHLAFFCFFVDHLLYELNGYYRYLENDIYREQKAKIKFLLNKIN